MHPVLDTTAADPLAKRPQLFRVSSVADRLRDDCCRGRPVLRSGCQDS